MPAKRLFIALTPPEPVRDTLAPEADPLPGVAWTRPEQLHVTLRFLGDIAEEQIPALIERLRSVQVAPFILPVETVGTFPPGRPARVLWIGVGSGHPRLFQLRQRLDDTLLAFGLPLDVRSFHPHITLARTTDTAAKSIAHWLHMHREFTAPPFRVEAFDLYSSTLQPDGAIYTREAHFPLTN